MKRLYFLIVLSLFAVKSYGIHNLLINGSSAPTVTTADTLNITASFETAGAIANGVLYMDINENGQLDSTDPWLYKLKFIDGNFEDEDETLMESIMRLGSLLHV